MNSTVTTKRDGNNCKPVLKKTGVVKIGARKTRWCFSIPAVSSHAANRMVAVGKTAIKTISISAVSITTPKTLLFFKPIQRRSSTPNKLY